MPKTIKLISAIVILIILLFTTTIIILTHVVNPNDYKQQIDKYVFEKTGRHIAVGNVGWSFMPWLGVDLKNVTLANTSGFNNPNLAKIGEIKIKVRFLPLLTGSARLGKIVVKNAHINLITNDAGKHNCSNWNRKETAGKANFQTIESAKSPTTKPNNKTSSIPAHEIHISGINITHSTIKIIDEKAKTKTFLRNLNLTTGAIDNAKDFQTNLNFILQEAGSKNKTKFLAHATTNLNTKKQVYQLHHLVISTKTSRPNLPILPATLKGNMIINIPQETLTLSPLNAQFANMKIQGQLKVRQLLQTPKITTHITSEETDLQPFIARLHGKSMFKGRLYFNAMLTTSGLSKKTLIRNLNGKGKMNISNGAITGFNLNELMTIANAIIHQKPAPRGKTLNLTSFSNLSGSFMINRGILQNNDLQLNAGQTYAAGTGAVNLNNTRVNYVLTAKYKTKPGAQQPAFELPIALQGPLGHISITPDYSSIAKQVLTKSIENKIKDYAGKAGKQFNLNKLFKGL